MRAAEDILEDLLDEMRAQTVANAGVAQNTIDELIRALNSNRGPNGGGQRQSGRGTSKTSRVLDTALKTAGSMLDPNKKNASEYLNQFSDGLLDLSRTILPSFADSIVANLITPLTKFYNFMNTLVVYRFRVV